VKAYHQHSNSFVNAILELFFSHRSIAFSAKVWFEDLTEISAGIGCMCQLWSVST